jgi:hypothetical protein
VVDDCQKLKPHLKGLVFESLEATAFFRQRVRVWRNGVLEGDPHDLDPRKVDLVRSSIISKEFLPRRRNSKYITLFFSPLSGAIPRFTTRLKRRISKFLSIFSILEKEIEKSP